MERVPELLKYLEEEMKQALQGWKQQLPSIKMTETKAILNEAKGKIEAHPSILVMTYLRSSYITENHRFKLAIYTEEPFLKEPGYHMYFDMTFLYIEATQHVESFIKKLSPPFFRILPYEKEEIRRYYMEQLCQNSQVYFEHVLQEMTSEDQAISVYFGEEMGELIAIGAV